MPGYITRLRYKEYLEKVLYSSFLAIIEYNSPCGFRIKKDLSINNIVKQTPLIFQERFFLLMDIIYPNADILRCYIAERHREHLAIYDWLFKLYTDEEYFTD